MPQNGGGRGVHTDPETGERVIPGYWEEFIGWLLTDPGHRMPKTQQEWAVAHDVNPDSLGRLKRHPDFRRRWEARAAELNISPERVQGVVDAMLEKALSGDVKAATLYLQYIDRFTPKKIVVSEDTSTSSLSDDELERALREELGSPVWDEPGVG